MLTIQYYVVATMLFDETEEGKGSEDFASCVRKHLLENTQTRTHVILFSDPSRAKRKYENDPYLAHTSSTA